MSRRLSSSHGMVAILIVTMPCAIPAAAQDMEAALRAIHADEGRAYAVGDWAFLEKFYDASFTRTDVDGSVKSLQDVKTEDAHNAANKRIELVGGDIQVKGMAHQGDEWIAVVEEKPLIVLKGAKDTSVRARLEPDMIEREHWRLTPGGPKLISVNVAFSDIAQKYEAAEASLTPAPAPARTAIIIPALPRHPADPPAAQGTPAAAGGPAAQGDGVPDTDAARANELAIMRQKAQFEMVQQRGAAMACQLKQIEAMGAKQAGFLAVMPSC